VSVLESQRHGRSAEAEVREILREAVRQKTGVGSTLHEIGMAVGGAELDLPRSADAPQPADFG
jgi:plasmid stability protein